MTIIVHIIKVSYVVACYLIYYRFIEQTVHISIGVFENKKNTSNTSYQLIVQYNISQFLIILMPIMYLYSA
jgi:hypothetical protein